MFDYVRDDSLLDEAIDETDAKRIDKIKEHLSGMRLCLDCGSTQRFARWDPLAISSRNEVEPWRNPWAWREL